ncbi:hypothetical protein GCM10010981_33440 [Dyella nitratireducens]|uniref:Uncharacterized protein n=1 Tax=Dyella nitratireducens TaxID=1849580 RepID=A0ABQ1GDK8_9GAMM|nr:hypothetical protein GCM10010981_33440 [Dyella nitratireducens]
MRELIGALVQAAIAELFVLADQGDRIRLLRHLCLEQLMDQRRGLPGLRGGVEGLEYLFAFRGIQQHKVVDAGVGRFGRAIEHMVQMHSPALNAHRIEKVGAVFEHHLQATLRLAHIQQKVEGCMRDTCSPAAVELQRLVEPVLACPALVFEFAVEIQHDLRIRRVGGMPLTHQPVENQFEGQLLLVSRQHLLRGRCKHVGKRLAGAELRTQGHDVDEGADHVLRLRGTVRRQHAHADVVLAAVAMQQDLHGGRQRHEQGRIALAGLFGHAPDQVGRKMHGMRCAAVRHQRRPGTIGRKRQQRGSTAQVFRPISKMRLDVLLAVAAPLPLRVIGVADRQRGQRRWLIRLARGIGLGKLVDQHTDRPAVVNDVMQGQQQHMQPCADLQQVRADQRPMDQVERLARIFHHDLTNLRIGIQLADIRYLQRP